MPLVKIEIIKGRSKEEKKILLECIHQALVDSIKIPDNDRIQRLYELDADDFEYSSNKSGDFTLIEITMFKGRSSEAKKSLYSAIVNNLKDKLKIDPNDVLIVINEPPLDNWGIRGGKSASEVDLGFNINV
jgi:4-oxalocrotonate tautomerase family enzyme